MTELEHKAKYYADNSEISKEAIKNAYIAGYEEARKWFCYSKGLTLPFGHYLIKGKEYQGERFVIWNPDYNQWLDPNNEGVVYDDVLFYKKI